MVYHTYDGNSIVFVDFVHCMRFGYLMVCLKNSAAKCSRSTATEGDVGRTLFIGSLGEVRYWEWPRGRCGALWTPSQGTSGRYFYWYIDMENLMKTIKWGSALVLQSECFGRAERSLIKKKLVDALQWLTRSMGQRDKGHNTVLNATGGHAPAEGHP